MLGKTIPTTLVIRKQSPCDASFHQLPPPVLVLRIILNFIIVFTNRENIADFILLYLCIQSVGQSFNVGLNVELRPRQTLMAIYIIQSLKLSNTIF